MSRHRDRWDDEDDDDRTSRPRRSSERGGLSPTAIILLVLGGVFILGVVVCGGLLLLGYQRAQKLEQQAAEANLAEARARLDQLEPARGANGEIDLPVAGVPPPKPGFRPAADPPPQPKPTRFATDDPTRPNHWRILFRSRKPELWNTNTQDGDDFAIPLGSAQLGTKYLRLRRMDTGEAIIIPMSLNRIAGADPPDRPVRWNGEGKDDYGGFHLGIAEGAVARFMEGQGTIGVLMDGFDANPGSGFGHAHHIENGGQRFSWRGKEIPPTVFEIAVTVDELTEVDEPWLRK